MKQGKPIAAAVAVLMLAACSASAPPPAADRASAAVQASLPAPVSGLDGSNLRARAERALREQRIHTPAGDSAVDYYLALREREPDAPGVASALTELQPYLLIAAEQALADGDAVQAQRLLALIERVDAHAPALPRLRESLRRVQTANREETAALAASLSPPVERALAAKPIPTPPRAAPSPPSAAGTVPTETHPAVPPVVAVEAPPAAAPPKPSAPAMPRLLSDSPPRYPLAALNRRLEGSVHLAFTIQPDGRVSDTRLLSAQPQGVFDEAALAAAARWRFEATGQRVTTTRTLTFRLPNGG